MGSAFQIMSCHRLSCGPRDTNQTPLLHCLTLEINLLHEACPVIKEDLEGVSTLSSLTTPSTYRESENRVIWSWEREADVLDFQLSRDLPTQRTVVRFLSAAKVQRFPVHQTSSAKSRKIPGKPRWVSHPNPRKINTKLHRPECKDIRCQSCRKPAVARNVELQGLPGVRTLHVVSSQLSKGGRKQATKHFSAGPLSRGWHWC